MRLRLDRSLEGSLAAQAAGRVIVIDAYRNWSCGTWIGDVTARWERTAPDRGFVMVASVDGVPVAVNEAVLGLLDAAGPTLRGGGRFRRNGLRVELDRPELWIDYLNRPATFPRDAQTQG